MLEPFLKWAGGKRWFVQRYATILPKKFNTYIEPFLGSGAVFFSLRPEKAILADINGELIETYRAIRDNWAMVFRELTKHHKHHSKEYYYKIRRSKPKSQCNRAARLIYLNRTCWNGLYRVNLKGEFNVPVGTKTNVLLSTDDFSRVSQLLQNAQLFDDDFQTVIDKAEKGDLIFVDPPYTVKHNDNGFIKYNEQLFSWDCQVRLSQCLRRAKNRGANIVLTNANSNSVKKLYEGSFKILSVDRHSIIAADGDNRKRVSELIITNIL